MRLLVKYCIPLSSIFETIFSQLTGVNRFIMQKNSTAPAKRPFNFKLLIVAVMIKSEINLC